MSIWRVFSSLIVYRYIACYKPALTLCSLKSDDDRSHRKGRDARPTLADLCLPPDLHITGRLDRDSEGLLLLTDDGKFTARVLSEDCHKRYWALVIGKPTDSALDVMRSGGLDIRGSTTRPPISIQILIGNETTFLPEPVLSMNRPGTWLEVVLNEGRNRQVRKITAAAGHKTIRLVRVAIGSLQVQGLKPGEWKYIDKEYVTQDASLC